MTEKKKNSDKRKVKKTEIVEKKVGENTEKVSNEVKVSENRIVAGTLLVIAVVFIIVIFSYNYSLSLKQFDYMGLEWNVIEEPGITWYHGNFSVLYQNSNRRYNLYIRNDPRENDVEAIGNFNYFKYGGIISFTPESGACRGEVSRGLVVLGDFLKNAVGMKRLYSGTTNIETFIENPDRIYAHCGVETNRSVIVVELGETPLVKQHEANPWCYTITIPDCEDGKTLEKFMLKAMEDMGGYNPEE